MIHFLTPSHLTLRAGSHVAKVLVHGSDLRLPMILPQLPASLFKDAVATSLMLPPVPLCGHSRALALLYPVTETGIVYFPELYVPMIVGV